MYFIHIRHFSAAEVREAKENWMAAGYFHPGAETVGSFVASRIYAVLASQYSYLSWHRLAIVGLVLTCGLWRRLTPKFIGAALCYSVAALVILLMAAALAVLGYYPLSPTRHSSILLPFTLPAVCLLLTHLCRGRSSWILVLSIVLVSGFLWSDHSLDPLFHNNGRKADTARMVAILRSVAGNGKLVFTDHSSAVVLNYYLEPGRSAPLILTLPGGPFYDYWWRGVHVVSSSSVLWRSPESFLQDLATLGKQRDLGEGIYVVNAGFSKPLAPALAFQRQPPVHWLVRNSETPEMFWMPLGGAQQVPAVGAQP
jgi:hypothetical protein